MKKEWNAPAIFDLTIQATAHRGTQQGSHHKENGFRDDMGGGNRPNEGFGQGDDSMSPPEFHTNEQLS